MSTSDVTPPVGVVRFSVFEVDLRSGELRRAGAKIKLQDQPFRLLRILLDHAGEVVTRDELQRQIWPSDTFVDFDRGLNNAVKRLREALGDTAESPRYIETLPKRGYRFIGALRTHDTTGREVAGPAAEQVTGPHTGRRRKIVVGAIALGVVVAGIGLTSYIASVGHRVSRPPATPVERPTIHSLAVIPLTNLSSDPAQEYLCDAITDALITEVAQLRAIRVISRTSVMRYKKTDRSLPDIARELNVDGIVEGTVQRSDDRVRITVQLIDASDKHLWGSVYERDLKDVFALEREVTTEIARKVQAEISTEAGSPPPQPRPVNVQALDAYLQGNAHLDRVGRGSGDEEKKKAAPFFQRAIELDPTFVQAYRGLVNAHCYNLFRSSDEDAAIIANARQRIAELDPRSQDGSDGPCTQERGDKSLSEEQQYRACMARNPNDSAAHREFAVYLDDLGRLDEGWKEQELAQQLDPHPDHMAPNLYLPDALIRRGRYDQAIELLLRIVEREPYEFTSHQRLAAIYEAKGMNREEIEELGWMAASYGHPEIAPRLRQSFAASGYRGALRRWARELDQLAEAQQFDARDYLAHMYLRLGDRQRGYKLLEDAYILRNTRPPGCGIDSDATDDLKGMRNDPQFSSDPRFLDLLRRIGFPQ